MKSDERKIIVLSQGCAANFGEGEKIARILSHRGNVSFAFPENQTPEAFYLNVCTVKGNAGALKLLKKAHETYPDTPIYITGCAPKDFMKDASRIWDQIHFTSLHEIEKIYEAVKPTANNLRESPFVGIVNIEEGCLDACAFCSTHLVKGRLRSFSEDFVVEQVKRLVSDGCIEIQLTGQDCACYGFDIGTNLAILVERILVQVPGDYKLRLGMGNPRHLQGYLERLLDCFTDNRVYKFIHLPVQSGSDRVLKAMNRKHSVEDYRKLAYAFSERFERFTLSTDLIVGHPGETQADFEETLKLLKETRPSVANITRFVARPGTVAARFGSTATVQSPAKTTTNKMDISYETVPDAIKHERSAKLFDAFQQIALENNREWIGKHCTVVTEKKGYHPGTTIARNESYRPVALQGDFPAGQRMNVTITGAEPFALLAELD